jgi:Leucine rich repeat
LCSIYIAIIFQLFYQIETKQISCEYISSYDYNWKIAVKECHMFFTTSIDSPNISMFTRDNTMETIAMEHNKKIFYLPDKIGDAYPNLKVIRASNCSIKDISWKSFKGLTELKELHLYFNQIEKIASGTFKVLKKLEILYLHNNQFEKIQSDMFDGLKNLIHLSLGLITNIQRFQNYRLLFFQSKTKSNS